uniref:Guanylate cyclase n=1 Tax=Macrostomum lignano TaxID=282301 RepID=A0A1I8FJD6_9PLAT
YYYVGNQLNSGCPLEIYNPDSPFPYNIVACNQTHNFSEVLRHSTGTYIHLSRRPVTQRKLLLKQLADRDPALTQFLRDFSLPFTFCMYSPSQVCEWLDYNLLNFVQLWLSPSCPLKIRIGLIWPSGFEFDDPSVLEFAELSVGILNSWRCQGNAKDAAFCSLLLLSNHQFELVPAGLDMFDIFSAGLLHGPALLRPPAASGVVAATCSKTAEPVAQASSRLGTAVVSPTVESPLFNRRDIYPNFYRTVPSYSAYPEVVASFLRKYSWEKLALLTNQKLFYSSLDFNEHLCLVEVVAEKDLTLHRALDSLRRAKEAQCQVIVMDYFRRGTCLYLCAAHQLAMSQRNNYAFILANWAKEIFTDAGANCTGTGALADEFVGGSGGGSGDIGGCTNAEITAVSDGHLIVKNYLPPARLAVYRRRLNRTVAKLPSADVFAENHFGVYTSDAIFLLASALGSLYTSDPIYIHRLKSDSVVKLYRKLLENSLSNDDHDFYSRLPVSEGYMMVWLRRYRADGAGYHGRVPLALGREQKITVEEIPVDPSEANEAVGFATSDGKFIRPLRADLDCPTAFLMRLLPGWSCLETLAAFCIVLVLLILGCLLMVLFGVLRYCQRRMRRKQSQPFKDIRERLAHKEVAREKHLSHLSHKNIIRLLAVCTAAEPFLIIMENCLYGDLKSFLMARRTHALCRSDGDTSPELLTQFAIDIASGLEYLHSQDPPVVHRDLALRNCLIHASYTVKIGDFGLARFAPDYYRMSSANAVPMRWMPPEAIQYAFYTVKSDVWAYAVVLYELVTFGKFPFYELSHQQASLLLLSRLFYYS